MMQHRLAREAENASGLTHGDKAFGCLFDEARKEFFAEENPPRRSGRELLAGDEAIVQPAVDRRGRDPKALGGSVHGQQLALGWLRWALEARNAPMVA